MADQRLEFKITANPAEAKAAVADLRSALSNNFADISKVSEGALRGLNNQVAILARQIPFVGQPLAGITQELFKLGAAKKHVDDLASAFRAFQTSIAGIAGGSNPVGASILKNLGIDPQGGLRSQRAAFDEFVAGLRSMTSESAQAAAAFSVLGASATADLIPALGGVAVAEEAATATTVELEAAAAPLGDLRRRDQDGALHGISLGR
jgi:hypothetical protein